MIGPVVIAAACGALCGALLSVEWAVRFAVAAPLTLLPLFYAYRFERRAICMWLTVAYTAGQLLVGLRWVYLGAAAHQGPGAYYTSAIALLFECIPYALLGLAASSLQRLSAWRWCVAIACLWTLCEHWRSTSALGVPYVQLGHALIDTQLVGLARFGGTEVLTFVGVLAAAALFECSRRTLRLRVGAWTLCAAIVVACVVSFNAPSRAAERGADVAVFQFGQVAAGANLQKYLQSLHATAPGTGFAVWPESSLNLGPGRTLEAIRSAVRARSVPLLAGGMVADRFGIHDVVMFFGRDGSARGFYAKRHLVPFGEYLPLPALAHLIIPVSLTKLLPDLSPGTGAATFVIGKRIAGPLVCYESAFPALARDEVNLGADILVGTTDDAWFVHAPGPWAVAQTARLVAIETGTPMVLAGTVGPSGVLDADGRWVGSLPVGALTRGTFTLPRARATAYDAFGDAPVLDLLVAIGLLAAFGEYLRRLLGARLKRSLLEHT